MGHRSVAAPLAKGVRTTTSSLGLVYFNCTTRVTIEPSSASSATLLAGTAVLANRVAEMIDGKRQEFLYCVGAKD